jgi:hypothetical protein
MTKLFRSIVFAGFSAVLSVHTAYAEPLSVDTGVQTTVKQIVEGGVNILLNWSGLVATGLFLLGAIYMVGSGGNDEYLSNGKKIMKASVIGLAIVLSAWLIISTAVYFLAG